MAEPALDVGVAVSGHEGLMAAMRMSPARQPQHHSSPQGEQQALASDCMPKTDVDDLWQNLEMLWARELLHELVKRCSCSGHHCHRFASAGVVDTCTPVYVQMHKGMPLREEL